jgi:hypothetical protein
MRQPTGSHSSHFSERPAGCYRRNVDVRLRSAEGPVSTQKPSARVRSDDGLRACLKKSPSLPPALTTTNTNRIRHLPFGLGSRDGSICPLPVTPKTNPDRPGGIRLSLHRCRRGGLWYSAAIRSPLGDPLTQTQGTPLTCVSRSVDCVCTLIRRTETFESLLRILAIQDRVPEKHYFYPEEQRTLHPVCPRRFPGLILRVAKLRPAHA